MDFLNFEMFQYAFMQRAFIGGSVIAILLGWIGVYVVSKKMSFVGDGVAHASLVAIAGAILLGISPLPTALVFSVFLAFALYYLEEKTELSSDAAIGMIFTTGMAVGVLLLQYVDGYVPDLVSFLFGNILAVGRADLYTILGIGFIFLILLALYRRQIAYVLFDPVGARLSGHSVPAYLILFYLLISVSVVLSIRFVGIVLVSALLVIPASIGKMTARSFKNFEIISIFASLWSVYLGLILSYLFDWPSGASIVVVAMTTFLFISIFRKIWR